MTNATAQALYGCRAHDLCNAALACMGVAGTSLAVSHAYAVLQLMKLHTQILLS